VLPSPPLPSGLLGDVPGKSAGRAAEGGLNLAIDPYVFTTERGEQCGPRNALRATWTAAKRGRWR
jgi:hypothetical protein